MLLLWQRSRQSTLAASQVCYFSCLQLAHHNSLPFTRLVSPLASTPDLSWPNTHTPHTLSMCALCHHLLDGSLRDFSSRVAMSVCLRFLCACCLIAFTTTTNTTIANYSPIPSSLPLSFLFFLSLFSLSICACCGSFIHSFIYITQPTTRTRPAHFAHSSCSFNLILNSTLHFSLSFLLSISVYFSLLGCSLESSSRPGFIVFALMPFINFIRSNARHNK